MNTLGRGMAACQKNPRWVAWCCLWKWLVHGEFLRDSLGDLAQQLSQRDRALAQQIAGLVCRNHLHLMASLRCWTKKLPNTKILLILECGLVQLHYMDKIPAHAALSATVELARLVGGEPAARITNAILRRSQREGLADLPTEKHKAMAQKYSYPEWLIRHWANKISWSQLEERLSFSRQIPKQWLLVHDNHPSARQVLENSGLQAELKNYYCVGKSLGHWINHPGFSQGWWSVQNPSAGLVVDLLEVHKGHFVLDACSAPGGKTILLRKALSSGTLVSSDISLSRLLRSDDMQERLGVANVLRLVMDGRAPALEPIFDRVLLDVPCSNLGVVARRPEVPLRLSQEEFFALPRLQGELLNAATKLLKPDGVLVYATCSTEEEETSRVVNKFLEKNPNWIIEDPAPWVDEAYVQGKEVRVNTTSAWDAFYAVRLRRKDNYLS